MRRRQGIFEPRVVGASAAIAIAMMANLAWSQVVPAVPAPTPEVGKAVPNPPSPAPGAVKEAKDTAKDAAQDATDAARDAAQGAKKTADDAAQGATDTARDAAKGAKKTADDAAQGATDTARDAAKEVKKTGRDAAQDVKDTARDAAQGAKDTARDAAQGAKDTAKRAQKDTAGTIKDAQDATKDAATNVRDATRNAARDVRDTAKDATNDVRDAARNATPNADVEVRGNVRTNQSIRTQNSRTTAGANNFRAADLGVWFDRSNRNGLIIADVAANAALAQVGFREGDRIVSVAGQPVAAEADFVRFLVNNNVRGRLNVIVLRDGQQQTLYVDPQVLTSTSMAASVDPVEQFGIVLDDRFDDRLVVWRVLPRSPAFYAGIRAGDVLTMFANQKISSPNALVQIVQGTKPGTIPIQVTRNGRARMIEADFPDLQVSERHTTLRQDLDAGTYIRSDVNGGARIQDGQTNGRVNANTQGQIEVDPNLPTVPDAINVAPATERVYSTAPRVPMRRGILRGRR